MGSDSYYKNVNSSQLNFTVRGALNSPVERPIGGYAHTDLIYFNTTVINDIPTYISADSVTMEYRKHYGTVEWKRCTPVNVSKSVDYKYYCLVNASTANLTIGWYDVRFTAAKTNYTSSNNTVSNQFSILRTIIHENLYNMTFNIRKLLNLTNMNVTIDILPNATVGNSWINATMNSSNPLRVNMSVREIGKYLRINVSSSLTSNFTYAVIKMNYTDKEINASGVVESSLRMYKYNSTTWVAYDNHSVDYIGGVNVEENYVWGNVTSFSDFAVGGNKSAGQACTTDNECDSDNCAADYDGSGSWCASSGNCAHDYNIGYANSGATCYGDYREVCTSGSWVATSCSGGCSSGSCITTTTTTATTSGSSSSGGSIAVASGGFTKKFSSITPFAPKTIRSAEMASADTTLTEIYIDVKGRVLSVKISVEKLSALPSHITPPISTSTLPTATMVSYEYISVSNDNLDDNNIEAAHMQFKMAKSWIEDNNIDRSTIAMYRYANVEWNKLSTQQVDSDDDYLYFEAAVPGFSYFAIMAEGTEETAEESEDEEAEAAEETVDEETTVTTTTIRSAQIAHEEIEQVDTPAFLALIIIIIIAFVLL